MLAGELFHTKGLATAKLRVPSVVLSLATSSDHFSFSFYL